MEFQFASIAVSRGQMKKKQDLVGDSNYRYEVGRRGLTPFALIDKTSEQGHDYQPA
jgi:hypothetical protein